jgi:hypothetical protein
MYGSAPNVLRARIDEGKAMITYTNLSRNPRVFKSLTGVTVDEFQHLLAELVPLWAEAEEKRLDRPDRQRAIGGGRRPELSLLEQLLLTLVWLRLYLTTEALGFLFGVHKSTVSRYTRTLLPLLRQVGEGTLGWPEPPRRGQNLDQACQAHPDLFALVDATEQPVQRPRDPEAQKAHYSGKKKRHTRKIQIIVNEWGQVRDVSTSTPGAVHDLAHFRQSGAAARIPPGTIAGGDAGYQGLQHELPDHSVMTPFKKSKHHPLSDEEKLLNQEFAALRITVENTICQFKHFHALADRFRHALDRLDDVFRAVLAIVNPRIQKRVAKVLAA